MGFKLRDHVIAFLSTKFDQFFAPIPTIHEDIEFTREREFETLNNPFRQRLISLRLISHIDFCMERATSSCSLGMIELRPQGEDEVSVKEGQKHPLVTKDPGHLFCRVSIPGTSGDLFTTFLNQCIINKKEKDRVGFDMKGLEEVLEFDSGNLFQRLYVLSQESGEAGEGTLKRGEAEGLDHGGGMSLLSQSNKSCDETGE